MALFKIAKGNSSNLSSQTLTEGFCWFTPDDGKFYIDATKDSVLTRIPLNAKKADTADAWTTGQKVYVNLGSADKTKTISGGSATAQEIGVDGTLSIANGGTGAQNAIDARTNLGLGDLATASSIANHSYTPAGSVTVTPTVTVNTTTVNSITAVGTLPSHGADTFNKGTLPSFTRGTFSAGTLPSLSMSVTNEVLSFTWSAGTLPSHAADAWSAGTLPSFTQGTFSAGTLPTKGSNTTVATGIKTATATASFSGTAATLSHTVS